ncbi:TPA: hypothetical protein HA278_04485 [Candidatus Woesearchaeota archaeon]|nr:hypothetical protein [archaeon]HIJ11288.1 hypothetical protein [Candidatus Woesearchaeota archaeon]
MVDGAIDNMVNEERPVVRHLIHGRRDAVVVDLTPIRGSRELLEEARAIARSSLERYRTEQTYQSHSPAGSYTTE